MEKDVISGFSSPFTEHWLVVGLSEGVQWEEAGMTEPGFTVAWAWESFPCNEESALR